MLEIQTLSAGYGKEQVLRDITLTIPAGKLTVIAGPNGCGKSTLLKALAGLIPMEGSVRLGDRELTALSRQERAKAVAYLPQSRPVPEITVENLVLHGRFPYLSYPRSYSKADRAAALEALETLGIRELAQRSVPSLSGGQRQQVYLAMALAQDTPVVLLDEPTTYLDIRHQRQLMDMARFLADRGKTLVSVLHDLTLALEYADHLILLEEGRAAAWGTPEEVFSTDALPRIFRVEVRRVETEKGWRYYYK